MSASGAPRDPDGSVSGVDRLNVLRRWECPEHGAERPFIDGALHICIVGSGTPCGREVVEVEYVPASQLAGAVDLLREIGRAANGQDAIPDDSVVGVTVPLRLVRAARAAGGQ